MMKTFLGTLGAILFALAVSRCQGEDNRSLEERKLAWRTIVDKWDTADEIKGMCFDPLESLSQFEADCTLQMTYDPRRAMSFKLIKDDTELLTIAGHRKSVFGTWKNRFYFIDYFQKDCGATVLAFDLTDGHQLWKKELKALGQAAHSNYGNEVCMRLDSNAIVIAGHEWQGSYVEVLDTETGETLAHRPIPNKMYPKREPR